MSHIRAKKHLGQHFLKEEGIARQVAEDLGNATFDETLALLGGVVLGVLGQITVRASLGNGGNGRRAINRLQSMEFGPQHFRAENGGRCFSHESDPDKA